MNTKQDVKCFENIKKIIQDNKITLPKKLKAIALELEEVGF